MKGSTLYGKSTVSVDTEGECSLARPKKVREGDAVLTFEHIVEAAMAMADADGIAKLSMRRLATELDCGVMSLYHYIADKEALVEALVDQVANEVAVPPADLDWRQTAQHLARSTLDAQLQHPWVVPIWSTTWPGPHRFALVELLLETLADIGLPPDVADLGFHALSNHIQGFAQQQISFEQLAARAAITGARLEELLADDKYARVREHVEFHRAGHDTPDEFDFTLNLILDGLERSIET